MKIINNKGNTKYKSIHNGEVRRDVWILLKSENVISGITYIHPHSRTNGHSHKDHEEHYYILRGRGYLLLDDERYDIMEGDDLFIPKGPIHTLVNPNDTPLEFLFVTPRISE